MRTSWSTILLLLGASNVLAAPEKIEKRAVSSNGKCGGLALLAIFGTTCKGSSFGSCCSRYGYCGSSPEFCGAGCQGDFGDCTKVSPLQQISTDGSCGGILSIGKTCGGSVFGNCCSASGYCGNTAPYCNTGCQALYGQCGLSQIASSSARPVSSSQKPASSSYLPGSSSVIKVVSSSAAPASSSAVLASSSAKLSSVVVPSSSINVPSSIVPSSASSAPSASVSLKVSTSGGCGLATGETCAGSTFGDCCSTYGYCGSTALYCADCNPLFGICPGSSSSISSGTTSSASYSSVSTISASSVSSIPSLSSSAATCASTAAPTAGTLPNCVRCAGQPGTDAYCGYDINTNYYNVHPKTCKVVYYELDITETRIAPDGRERFAMVVNGQMPGPEIRASWGDTVVVKVNNKLSVNGTSIHFHGIRQLNNTMNDGVPAITQCPIAPGSSMTYTWVAEQYGTTWYHSHFAIQTWEGVLGPLIIDGPSTAPYDIDLGPLHIQDWSLRTVDEQYNLAENAAINPATGKAYGGPVLLQNGLLNGKNTWGSISNTTTSNSTVANPITNSTVPAATGNGTVVGSRYSISNIIPGKTYRLRIINSSIQSTYKFFIDGHKFQVIAMDLVPIVPYVTTILNINIGQRYDILVTADQIPGNYWLRTDNQNACAGTIQAKDIKAVFSYVGFSGTPTSTAYSYTDACIDEPLTSLVPKVPINVGPADISEPTLNVLVAGNSAQLFKWTLNSYSFLQQWEQPTLLSIDQTGTYSNSSGPLLFELPKANQWVYIIIQSPIPLPHPIHLHGHDFFILGAGPGSYASGTPLQLTNPPRRDTVLMPAAGYVVIGFITDNPGTWLAHCHIGWHTSMGFAIQFVERKAEIKPSGGLSNSCGLEGNCASWKAFAASKGIVQHDSGV